MKRVSLLKSNQNRKNFFVFLKVSLFLAVLGIIYWQIRNFDPEAWSEFKLIRPISLITALILVTTNIWLAYLKWSLTVDIVSNDSTRSTRVQSFFAGLVTGMLTPNMIGNFIGRAYYFEKKARSNIILLTLLSNYGQFLASLTFGWLAILFLGELLIFKDAENLFVWLGIGIIVSYFIYYFIDKLLLLIKKKSYAESFRMALENHRWFRTKILGISLLRFVVFTIQFSLVLNAFGEPITVSTILAIWQVYLILMIVPSLFLGKVGVRESVALFVLTSIGMNEYAILFSSLIIWTINSLFPALLGFIICKKEPNAA